MYPQYWVSSIGGIIMKYSYEYKIMSIDLYRQGRWPETPIGANKKEFHNMIQEWVRTEEMYGPEALVRLLLVALPVGISEYCPPGVSCIILINSHLYHFLSAVFPCAS